MIPQSIIQLHREVISGQKKGLSGHLLRSGLDALERLYRDQLEKRTSELLARPKDRLPVPVVSVGNITAGGTGKTPVARFLAGELERRGARVGVAMRGYGREQAEATLAVSRDGPEELKSYRRLGDEAPLYLMGEPPVDAAVGRDRKAAALALIEQLNCEAVILDDGFQYLTLHRDLDVATVDPANPFGYGKLLPRGLLREPAESLARADAIWLTKCNLSPEGERAKLVKELKERFPDQIIVCSNFVASAYINVSNGSEEPLERLSGAACLGFCGVGSPEGFEALLRGLGLDVKAMKPFPDHHRYTAGEIEKLGRQAVAAGASCLVATEKDAVKLKGTRLNLPLYAVRMRVEVFEGASQLEDMLDTVLKPREAAQ